MKRLIILFLILNFTPGCIIIPLPDHHQEEIDKVQEKVAIGSTTREEIISILGPPHVARDRYIIYQQKAYSGGALLGILWPNQDRVIGKVFMDLYFEFDGYGVLTVLRVDKYDQYLLSVKDNKNTSKKEEACDPGAESCP